MFKLQSNPQFKLRIDILSGLTVALALVPEAVAFAFVAGVDPIVGLHAAFIVGIITALFGGRPGMISGATGAIAIVLVALVATHGIEYMFAASTIGVASRVLFCQYFHELVIFQLVVFAPLLGLLTTPSDSS